MSIDTYFCFCCLSTNDLSPIYNDTDIDHGNILLQLFHLNISCEDYEDDGYICKDCAHRLKQAADFKAQVFDTLNVLQNNGLIELTNEDHQMTVKKVTSEVEEDEEKINSKADTPSKSTSIKKEPTVELPKTKIERDKPPTSFRKEQKSSYYEVTDDLKCEFCGVQMPNVYVYHSHMNQQHFPNHICDACGKGFLTEKRLKRHLPSHKTGPFKCQLCDAEFTNFNTLNSHRQRKHSDVPLYKCSSCPERFYTLTRRALHLSRAHAAPAHTYRCAVCDKRFLLAGNLNSHMRNTHQRVKRHFCPVPECQAGFFQKQELTAHMATHTGLNMFQCAECPKGYPRKKALIVHMRTHTDDRRFSCEYCGKRFIQKCTLLVHIKTHNREKGNET